MNYFLNFIFTTILVVYWGLNFFLLAPYSYCVCRLQAQESMLAQSQKCVQELTGELRNRCLELRELNYNMQDQEKLLQVREGSSWKEMTLKTVFQWFVNWLNCCLFCVSIALTYLSIFFKQENEVLRKQNVQLSEENGKLVGHKNHKQRIEYLVKLKMENTKLQEVPHVTSPNIRGRFSFFVCM